MRLFIAEKPDLAKAIVEGLGGGVRKEGYYDCAGDIVTWCYGHMLQLFDPEDYDPRFKQWNMDDLPVVHIPWRKKVSKDKKDQFNVIIDLLKKADAVVNAGDPDEEGQLLVDEILQYARWNGPTKRVLINDNNTSVVRKALAAMRDNREFAGLSAAAEARSVGDQLYGYNLTRAYTLAARSAGYDGTLSVGRVQTAILGLVVRRDREFESHQKAYYYNVVGEFAFGAIQFHARYTVTDVDQKDDKGRLIDRMRAEAIKSLSAGKPARLLSVKPAMKEEAAPLPYNLIELQIEASKRYGYKPDQVLEVTQTLKDKYRLITYNRSDCQYLSDDQHEDAPAVLAAIAETAQELVAAIRQADPALKSRAFNSSKVSAHHGIVPTQATANLSALTLPEQRIYTLIAINYIAQFFPKHEFRETVVEIEAGGHRFACRSKVTTRAGWLALFKDDAMSDEEDGDSEPAQVAHDLSELNQGADGDCTRARIDNRETKPRPRYTMASLLKDLTRVAKYVTDQKLRELLIAKDKDKVGEHGGIGTPATRDKMIAKLFERTYFAEQGNSISSTKTGREFYDSLPQQATYPDMTALWHEQQLAIQAGGQDVVSFIQELVTYITGEVDRVKVEGCAVKVETIACPSCGKGLRRRNGANGAFWGCTGYPECKETCEDKGGKPVLEKHSCPKCGKELRRRKGSNGWFWSCTGYQAGCLASFDDKRGKPVLVDKEQVSASVMHKCTNCGHGLVRRPGKKDKNSYWWGCSGYPACKQTYFDLNGKPNYSKA